MNTRTSASQSSYMGALATNTSTVLIKASIAEEGRYALLGCNAADIPARLTGAKRIVEQSYPDGADGRKNAILTELAARVRNGIDSHTAGRTALELALLYLDQSGRLSKRIRSGVKTGFSIDIEDGNTGSAIIGMASFPDLRAQLPETDRPSSVIWHDASTTSDKDLAVLITDDAKTMSQALTIPDGGAKRLIWKVEKEMAKIPVAQHFDYAVRMPVALIEHYRRSLEGAVEGLPASCWDWVSTRDIVAGMIAWLLRRDGMLDEAVSNAEHGFIRIIVCDDGSLDIAFQSVPAG